MKVRLEIGAVRANPAFFGDLDLRELEGALEETLKRTMAENRHSGAPPLRYDKPEEINPTSVADILIDALRTTLEEKGES